MMRPPTPGSYAGSYGAGADTRDSGFSSLNHVLSNQLHHISLSLGRTTSRFLRSAHSCVLEEMVPCVNGRVIDRDELTDGVLDVMSAFRRRVRSTESWMRRSGPLGHSQSARSFRRPRRPFRPTAGRRWQSYDCRSWLGELRSDIGTRPQRRGHDLFDDWSTTRTPIGVLVRTPSLSAR